MAERPSDPVYAVDDVPPPARLAVLGLQYAILIAVYLIMVVLVARAAKASAEVTQSLIGLGFVAAAIGTVAQSWRGKLFGSGYLAPPVFSAIYLGPSLLAANAGGLAAVAGMTIFAGIVEAVLSRLLARLRVVFQPAISGFTVLIVGLQLGIVGFAQTLDVTGENSADFDTHVAVAFLTLAVAIGFSVWGRGLVRLICTLIGLLTGVAAGLITGIMGEAWLGGIAAADWLALPDPSVLSYSFDPALLPAFLAAGLAATLRSIGVITSCQRINDAAWKRPDGGNIQRGVLGDAIGTIAAGLLGAPGMCVAPSLVGVSSATGATSRVIALAAGAFVFTFAFLPKISAANRGKLSPSPFRPNLTVS
jgi:xanthine permease XanP